MSAGAIMGSLFEKDADKPARMRGHRETFYTMTARGDAIYLAFFSESHLNEIECTDFYVLKPCPEHVRATAEDFRTLREYLQNGMVTMEPELRLDYESLTITTDENGDEVVDAEQAPITELFAMAARRAKSDAEKLREMSTRAKDDVPPCYRVFMD